MTPRPALILRHPSAPQVRLTTGYDDVPYYATPESIAKAKAAAALERAEVELALKADDAARLEGTEMVRGLIGRFGARRVKAWVANISAETGG